MLYSVLGVASMLQKAKYACNFSVRQQIAFWNMAWQLAVIYWTSLCTKFYSYFCTLIISLNRYHYPVILGFPCGSTGKEYACNAGDLGSIPGLGYPLTSLVAQMVKRLPTMQETRVWSLGWEDPLEKEMATHSSTPAWKIPWMEERGRLQSMGSQRVRHDWVTSLSPTPVVWPREFHGLYIVHGVTKLDKTEWLSL